MFEKKKLCRELFSFFILLFLLGRSPLFANDEVLDYALNLLKEKKVEIEYDEHGKSISIKKIYDESYEYIAYAYFELGSEDKAIKLLDKIVMLENKNRILKSILSSKRKLALSTESKMKNVIEETKEISHKIILCSDLCRYYLETNEKQKAIEIFALLNKISESEKNSENYIFFLERSLLLVTGLIKNGFEQEAGEFLKNFETYVLENKDFFMSELLAEKYIELNQEVEVESLLEKMSGFANHDPHNLFSLSLILLKLEKYEEAEKTAIKIFRQFEKIKDIEERLNQLEGFLHLDHILSNRLILNLIGNSNKIREILDQILSLKSYKGSNDFRYIQWNVRDQIIELLLKIGNYRKAKALAEELDRIDKTTNNTDYYYYALGLIYDESYDSDMLISLADIIKKRAMAVDLLIRAARKYRERAVRATKKFIELNEMNKYRMTLEKAINLISKSQKEHEPFLFGKVGDVVMEYLDGGFNDEAYQLTKYESNDIERDVILFEVAQDYVINRNIERGREISTHINDVGLKALILSKIAAQSLLNDKITQGLSLFKKAIKIVINGEANYLDKILKDYVNAIKFRKIVKSNLWETRFTVN